MSWFQNNLQDFVALLMFWKIPKRLECHGSKLPCQYIDFANCNHGNSFLEHWRYYQYGKQMMRND